MTRAAKAKSMILAAATVAVLMALSGSALAATPQDIYDDYTADRSVDGPYTRAEIDAYLNDATVFQYQDSVVRGELDALLTRALPYLEAGDTLADALAKSAAAADPTRSRFPFTGAPVAVMLALAGAALLLAGAIRSRAAA